MATNSPAPTTESESTESADEEAGIACVSNCEPEYPDDLEGEEGSAGVKLTIDPNGNVIGAELSSADSNSQVNRQALLAARQMEFSSPPGGNAASVQVKSILPSKVPTTIRLAVKNKKEKSKQPKNVKNRRQPVNNNNNSKEKRKNKPGYGNSRSKENKQNQSLNFWISKPYQNLYLLL
ncbi:MAG: energy transducer TonB [Hydrococcus sp. SU_1_0]|nr:energy transducer TonB [Hydrococcus sp. SU_1_0]